MQDNNFEKQVEQKMEELSFPPSGEVWQKVSVAIKKRKNDRNIFVIISLLLLALSASIFIINYQPKKFNKPLSEKNNSQRTIETESAEKTMSPLVRATTDSTANISLNKTKIIPQNKQATIKRKEIGKYNLKNGINNRSVAANSKKLKSDENVTGSNLYSDKKSVKYTVPGKSSIKIGGENTFTETDVATARIDSTANKEDTSHVYSSPINDADVIANANLTKNTTDSIQQVVDTVSTAQSTLSKNVAVVKLPVPGKRQNKWMVGLAFTGGITATQSSYLGAIGLGNSDGEKVYSAPNQSTGGLGGSIIPGTASKITTGFGYSFGMYLQRNISPKTNVLIGLNYKTYTSSMVTGERINNIPGSNINDVIYSSGNAVNYKNHFHFIELPVSFRFNVRKQSKLPVYLNSGISIAQFLGSNALQFDTASGGYFKNNVTFRKTLVSVSAGILFSLPWRSTSSIMIGPDINFSLTEMSNAGLYKNRRYSFFGIQLQKNISSNRK
ncbi:MAG: hypothetical protein ABIN94_09940 [Ferruginibacter sp.]